MCNTSSEQRANFGDEPVERLSLSTFNFLRTCNRFIIPSSDCHSYYGSVKENKFSQFPVNENSLKGIEELQVTRRSPAKSPILDVIETVSLPAPTIASSDANITVNKYENKDKDKQKSPVIDLELLQPTSIIKQNDLPSLPLQSLPVFPAQSPQGGTFISNEKSTLPGFEYINVTNPSTSHNCDFTLMELNRFNGIFPAFLHRRPRGEKRPIPEEQKDEKYYERRKRNNEAAKKSRDARKIREDRIAFRAALLEQENSILRAQMLALRDELRAVRQLLNSSMATTVFPERPNAVFEPVLR